jgi:hypothetical protein
VEIAEEGTSQRVSIAADLACAAAFDQLIGWGRRACPQQHEQEQRYH